MKKSILAAAVVGVVLLPVAGQCYERYHSDHYRYGKPVYHHRHHNHNGDLALGLAAVTVGALTLGAMNAPVYAAPPPAYSAPSYVDYRYAPVRPEMCRYEQPVYDRFGYVIRTRIAERPCGY